MNPISFTQPIIKGIKYTKMLPNDYALVLEGGGTRGFYSSGVFEAFMDAGIMFPYIIGVSAGVANVLSYVAGQRGRSRVLVEKYVGRHEYQGYRNMMKYGSLFNFDYILNTIPQKHLFWDRDIFDGNDIRLLTGATDCNLGETVWFEKQDITSELEVIRASCSLPIVSKIVKYNGYELLDGGIISPIPIEKSIEDGNQFHVIVLTRNQGYQKPPFKQKRTLKLLYKNYPKLVEAMMIRHERYNKQLSICEQLEKEGKAIIIRPKQPLMVNRTGRNIEKMLALYDEGQKEGEIAVRLLLNTLDLLGNNKRIDKNYIFR